MVYESLVISGGGIRGIAALGALHYFYTNNNINEITTYAGTSIGSVICLLLICGYSPMDILTQFINIDIVKDFQTDLKNILSTHGLIDMGVLAEKISILVKKKLDYVPTLGKLYELTHKKLIITTTNVTKQKPEYLSYESNPNLSCIDAIKMSCNIPFLFQKIVYNNCIYVDGGLVDNFPILAVDDGESEVLGINLISNESNINEDNLIGYMIKIIMIPSIEICNIKNSIASSKSNIVNLIVNVLPIDFVMDKNAKMDMFLNGFNNAKLDIELKDWEWNDD